jgi:phosphatidylserine synthase 1
MSWRDRGNEEAFRSVNELYTDDVHISFLYHPRSISVLALSLATLAFLALGDHLHTDGDDAGAWTGAALCACLAFLVFSAVALPNGPFVRPHPVVWRVVLGVSVLYLCALVALVAVPTATAARALAAAVGAGGAARPGDTATACALTARNLWARADVFVLAHFLGWVAKAVLLRDVFLCLVTSCAWELSELVMVALLPNFRECWWDAVVFDILGANLAGIIVGTRLCAWLEMRRYRWVPVSRISTRAGKLLRAAQQFTPASWAPAMWDVGPRAFVQMVSVSLVLQTNELAAFFLKHNFAIDTKHWINTARLVFWSLAGSSALRQGYVYASDPRCKRLGTQAWVAGAALAVEILLVVKSSTGLFRDANVPLVLATWLVSQIVFLSLAVSARSVLFATFPSLAPKLPKNKAKK